MQDLPLPATASAEREKLEAARIALSRRFEIRGEFIRASQMARILGACSKSVLKQSRADRFPIPHRLLGRSLVFKLDDFVEWYCGEPTNRRPSDCASIAQVDLTPMPSRVDESRVTESQEQRARRFTRQAMDAVASAKAEGRKS